MAKNAKTSGFGSGGGLGLGPARRLLGLLLAGLGLGVNSNAQERDIPAGTIKGTVTDLAGVPVAFANVIVLGTDQGASTDARGRYVIAGVPPGDYTIRISFLGYHSLEQAIRLPAGKAILLDARLRKQTVPTSSHGGDPFWKTVDADDARTYTEAAQAMETLPFGFYDGNTRFALALYRELASVGSGNLVISPYSAASAVGLAYAGARGATATEMGRGLRVQIPPQEWHPSFGKLITYLEGMGNVGAVTLETANSLWVQEGFALIPEYLQLTERFYDAAPQRVDFVNRPEAAAARINDWVSERTRKRIPKLLEPDMVDPSTRLVLVNAVYFLGDWRRPFEKESTHDDTFFAAGGERTVPFMHQTEDFRYGDTGPAQVLEMPYQGNLLSMIVLLPRERDGLATLEAALTPDTLREALGALSHDEVRVTFPRFTFRWSASLVPALQSLGMPTPFTDRADFSGMAETPLSISEVVQEAFIQVDETGTEATAATALTLGATSMPMGDPPPEFRADHPFLFLIRDNATGTILFLGRVLDPS